jgi:hypothetical protein
MPNETGINKKQYYIKSLKWLAGNVFWGLIPLWFLLFINTVSGGKAATEEINHIVAHDGVILFVCTAIMGTVLVEYVLTGYKVRIWKAYRVAIIPCFISLLLLTNYSLILAHIITYDCFSINSWTSRIVGALTILFCIFTKTEVYIKEDTKHG